jgi:tol-pal system protein YbgF
MIKSSRFLIAALFAFLLPLSLYAEAPVVDDSENFALLDNQQAGYDDRPFAKEQAAVSNDEERPFATDSADNRSASSGNNASLLNKVQGLQQEIQELRGQLEVQSHELKLLREQQLSFYKDIDARLRQGPLKTAKNAPTTPITIGENAPTGPSPLEKSKATRPLVNTAVNNPAHINPADEQISYLAAYELVKKRQFDQALIAMQDFVSKYPQGGYTSNAQYWLGELYMVKKDYPGAIEHFEIVLQQFPSSSKSAASMLKLGYALAASGNREEAIRRLQQVVQHYPDTNTAQLAKAKLASLSG